MPSISFINNSNHLYTVDTMCKETTQRFSEGEIENNNVCKMLPLESL